MNLYGLNMSPEIQAALDEGAALVVSISGGKDSQAMLYTLARFMRSSYPDNHFSAVHADLGRAEWPQTRTYCARMTRQAKFTGHGGSPRPIDLKVVRRTKGDLIQRMEERMHQLQGTDKPFWPSSAARYCTSDLKRGPIHKMLRTFQGTVINAVGLRAEESRARAQKRVSRLNESLSTQTRTVYDWHPILDWKLPVVWSACFKSHDGERLIEAARERYRRGKSHDWELDPQYADIHPAYVMGNERLSCAICILGSRSDIRNGIKHNPELAERLVEMERESGFSFRADLNLGEFILNPRDMHADGEQISLFPPCAV